MLGGGFGILAYSSLKNVPAQVDRTGLGQSLSTEHGSIVTQTPSSAVTSVRRQPRSLRPQGPSGVVVSSGRQAASFALPCTQTAFSSGSDIGSPHDCVQKSVPSSWLAAKQVIDWPLRSVPHSGSRAAVSQVKTRAWKASSSTEQASARAASASSGARSLT